MSVLDLPPALLRAEIEEELSYRRLELYRPYPKQRLFHSKGITHRERLFLAGNQLGKLQPTRALVLTPTGWRAIGTIKPGDRVIGGDGKPCNVLAVYPQGVKPMVAMRFDYGDVVLSGEEHLWRTQRPASRWRTACRTIREAGRRRTEMVPNPQYGQWAVLTTREMRAAYGDQPTPKYRHATPHVGVVEFDLQPVPLDPYLLGVLLGDGSLRHGLGLSTADAQMVEMVGAALPAGVMLRARSGYDYALTCGQKDGAANPLLDDLRTLGMAGKGAADKRVPNAYLWNSPAVRLAVLQGLMDTDGTCEKSGITSFTSISAGLAEDVTFLARSFGAKTHTRSRVTSYRAPDGGTREGQRSYTVTIRLPHIPLFRLDRKAARYRRPVSTCDHHIVESYDDAPAEEAVCIAVDSPDHTYVTEGFIVTHNTLSAGAETAMHLTGRYPLEWPGRVWQRGVVGWAASETGELTRDTVERMLLGRAGKRGSGMIPADAILDMTASRGAADAVATARIRHTSGGTSLLVFKSYDQGRERWQGETLDISWFDEEPPADIYDEGLTRTNATGGFVYLTCTPLQGMTEVIERFFPVPNTPDRDLTMMTIEDAAHYSPEQRERVIASYPEHEREARARGIPVLGSGRVFPVAEALLREPAPQIPRWWRRICGMDFGHGDHPTAAVWLAYDNETDTAHVYDAYRNREPGIVLHAAALRARGDWIPIAWPPDGEQGDRLSGETVANHYRAQGCALLGKHATHKDGGVGVEAGIVDMLERMRTGRLRVAEHLSDWWEEYRLYHRKDGKLVKQRDDLMSATRYGVMMLRHAATEPDPRRLRPVQAEGGYDPQRW